VSSSSQTRSDLPRRRPQLTPRADRPRTDWRLVRQLLPYVQRNRRMFALAMVLLIPAAVAGAFQPVLIGEAIGLIRKEQAIWPIFAPLHDLPLQQGITWLAGAMLVSLVARSGLEAWQGYVVQKVGQTITADIRNDLFAHVTSLAVRFFDRTPVGKLITRLTSDVEALGEVFSSGAIGVVGDLVAIVVLTVMMFSIQWQLALLPALMLGPVTWLIIYFQQQYRQANYRAREELSQLNSMLQENVVGIGVVQLFRREAYNSQLFSQVNRRYIRAVDRTIFYDSAISAILEWVSLLAIAGVLWVGSLLILQQQIGYNQLATFIFFSQRLFDPLRQFAEKFTAIQAGLTAIERVGDILDEPVEIRDALYPQPIEQPRGKIQFEQVSFAYKADDYVLKNLDFTIEPGEKIALVGPTGAGKSSIIRLLSRLYEPTQGRILIDGVDIRDLSQTELRRHLSVILQDGFVFAGDVTSNITLGDRGYSLDAVQQAARDTNVHDLIQQLPQGYHTQLRERGTNLSSGQKQLLAFARAALRDPKILVLDEATASLDVKTEAQIQDALNRLLASRTAIIIAHRLSTIRNVDRIFVLKRGELIESGSHEDLLAQGGLYASLYQLQMLEVA
jgi:ATP-binding cassette, subfamily B, multidrug efflux pump